MQNTQAYPTWEDGYDSGTDSDTISSDGETDYSSLIPQGTPEPQIGSALFWAYQRTKAAWRKFSGKPVRRARRFFKRKGKGKGRGNGHRGVTAYLATAPIEEIEEILYAHGKGKGKGKSKGKRTSGLGFGRKTNPKGKDGNIMKCHECDSEDHLVAQCPRRNNRNNTNAHLAQPPQQHWFANTDSIPDRVRTT